MTEDAKVYTGPIAGVSFGHYKFRPDRLVNRVLVVVPKPENEYDAKAVALMAINGSMAHHVGYVPREQTWRIHEALAAGSRLDARVTGTRLRQTTGSFGRGEVLEVIVSITTQVRVVPAAMKVLKPAGTRRILL
jgi:hypothetical protein